ncbi:restriction endonuclease subunit S [Mycoplasma bovis]|nr:restriction endonuclease subunit S [Mycoplasmopsis bovis]
MSNKLLVPQIRFKEFTNAWEQEKLGNLTILNRFPQISAQRLWELNQYFGEVFLLPSSDNNNWKCKYSKEIANLINTGEVITIGRARNPNVKYVNGAFISSQNHIIESKTTDALLNKFLYLFITKVGKKFYGFESTYPMFTKIDFLNTKFSFPIVSEQIKIIKTIDILDFLITLHQRKLLSLKNLKSRLLDRMFCDEKSQFPSIRFKEFTNTWEQEKLGNLTILNRFPQISAQRLWELNQYFGEVFLLPSSDNNNWKCKYSKEIANLINTGEVITIGRARNPNVKYVNGAFISSQNHIIESKTTDALLNKFLYLFITKVGKKFYGFESTYPMFTKIDFLNTKFSFPIVSEQIKIIKTIDILDFLITLHQRKLNSLKNIKNTLLNKMFV